MQRKTVTVLFCDVTGSTALGESVDPERLRGVLARFVGRERELAFVNAACERAKRDQRCELSRSSRTPGSASNVSSPRPLVMGARVRAELAAAQVM